MILSLRKSIFVVALTTLFMLLVPLLAMQLTQEVDWGSDDFAVAGALLFGAGMIYVIAARRARRRAQRAAVAAAVLCGLALIWAELAVGLFR
jgi:hypothetical protein